MSSLAEGLPYLEIHIQTLSYSSADTLTSIVQQANTNISSHRSWLEKLPQSTSAPVLELRQDPGPPSAPPIPAACTSLLTSALSAASSSASANIAPSLALLQASVSSANNAFNSIRDSAAAALSTASSSMNSAAVALSTASASIDSLSSAAAAASSSASVAMVSIQSSASSAVAAAQRSGSIAVEAAMTSVTSANSAQTKAQNTTKLALAITFSIIGSSLLSILLYHLITGYRRRRRWHDQDRLLASRHSPSSSRSQPISIGDAVAHSRSVVNLERERAKTRQSIARDRAKTSTTTSVRELGPESEAGRKSLGSRDTRSRETVGSVSQFPLPRGRVPSLPSMAQIYDSAQAEANIPPPPPLPPQPALAFELMQQREAEAQRTYRNRPDPHPGQRSSLNPEAERVQAWLAHPPPQRIRYTGEMVERDNRAGEEHPLRRNPSQDFIPPPPSRDSSLHYGTSTNMNATPPVPKGRWSAFPSVVEIPETAESARREIQKALEKARAEIAKANEQMERPKSRKTTLVYDPYRPNQPPTFETMWVDEDGDHAVEDGSTTLYEGVSRSRAGSRGLIELVASPTDQSGRKSMAADVVSPSIFSPRTLPDLSEEGERERDKSPESVMREAYGGREFPLTPKSKRESGVPMGGWLKEGIMSPREVRRMSEDLGGNAKSEVLLSPRSLRRQILAEGGIQIPARSPSRVSGVGIGKAI